MLKGPTAYALLLAQLALGVGAIVALLITIAYVFLASTKSLTGSIPLKIMFSSVVVLALAGFATAYWRRVKDRREILNGYTTFVNGNRAVDIRDPRDGRVLVKRGALPSERRLSLAEAREFSSRTRGD